MAKLFLESGDSFTLSDSATVFGAVGTETVKVTGAANITVDANVERLEFSGNIADYTFVIVGNVLTVSIGGAAAGTFTLDGDTITTAFADGSGDLVLTGLGVATLDGVAVPTTDGAITGTTLDATDPSTNAGSDTTAGQTFTLTNSSTADVVIGTSGNDTITGAAGTLASTDVITDGFTNDSDSLAVTLNSATLAPTITNIEAVTLSAQFLTTGLAFTNVTGASTITLDSGIGSSTGTVTDVSSSKVATIIAGSNISTLNVTSLAAGTSSSVSVNAGSASAINLNTGAAADTYVVDVASSATVDVQGSTTGGTDVITLNLAGNATYRGDADGEAAADIETLTVNNVTSGAVTLTAAGTTAGDFLSVAAGTTVDITGTQAVTLAGDADVFDGVAATNSGTSTLTLKTTSGGAATLNYNEIVADTVDVTTVATGQNIVINENSTLLLSLNNASQTYDIDNTSGSLAVNGTLNVETAASQGTITTGTNVATAVFTNTGSSAQTYTAIATDANTNTVVLAGTNDLTISTFTATGGDETITATGLSGVLTMTTISNSATVLGGTNNDVITQSSANTILIRGGDGADTLTGNSTTDTLFGDAGNDTIDGAGGVDTINGGEGVDIIISGAAADIIDFTETTLVTDTLVMTGGAATTDVITGFSSEDLIQIDLSDVVALATDLVAAGDATSLVASQAMSTTAAITGTYDLGTDANANILVLDGTFSTSGDVETALETGGSRALTANNDMGTNDIILVLYSNGSHSFLSAIESTAGVADNASFVAADLTNNVLIQFTGIDDASSLIGSNFAIIA